jgi:predicted HAD superfamily Cof-like phosphohydrolase
MTHTKDVKRFLSKFGQHYEGPPRLLPPDVMGLRSLLIIEEVEEFITAQEKAHADPTEFAHRAEVLDALVDVVYCCIAYAALSGYDFDEAWRRVHEANMQKRLAKHSSESKRGSSLDIVKPEGWQPPNLRDLVNEKRVARLRRKVRARERPGSNVQREEDYHEVRAPGDPS